MSDLGKLEKRKKDAEDRFAKLKDNEKSLAEKRAELDRQLSLVRDEQVRLQGEFRLVNELIEEATSKKKKDN